MFAKTTNQVKAGIGVTFSGTYTGLVESFIGQKWKTPDAGASKIVCLNLDF